MASLSQTVPVLATLSDDERAILLATSEERHYRNGDVVIEEQVRGEGLYVIASGSVRVFKGRGHGQEAVATLRAGDHFGEMSLISQTPTSASVRADGDVTCLFVPSARFRAVVEQHAVIGRKVLWQLADTLSRRLVATDQQYARALRRVYRRSAVRHLLALFKLNTRIMLSLFWVWFRRKIRLPMKPEALSRVHRRNARAFKETASRLKGANVKVGQLASLQAHLLPAEYVEARATEAIGRELALIGVKVPAVHWRYTTRRVLTLEFIEGTKLDNLAQLRAWGVDRAALMRKYAEAFLHQAFDGGFFHCDPHPSNVFCTPDGGLRLIDFGMVKRLPDVVRDGLMKEILGGFFNNPRLYADGIIQRGVVAEEDREKLEQFARDLSEKTDMPTVRVVGWVGMAKGKFYAWSSG